MQENVEPQPQGQPQVQTQGQVEPQVEPQPLTEKPSLTESYHGLNTPQQPQIETAGLSEAQLQMLNAVIEDDELSKILLNSGSSKEVAPPQEEPTIDRTKFYDDLMKRTNINNLDNVVDTMYKNSFAVDSLGNPIVGADGEPEFDQRKMMKNMLSVLLSISTHNTDLMLELMTSVDNKNQKLSGDLAAFKTDSLTSSQKLSNSLQQAGITLQPQHAPNDNDLNSLLVQEVENLFKKQ